MLNLNYHLEKLESEGKFINIGLVGAGQMGRGMVSQMFLMKGIKACIVSDIVLENAINAYILAGIKEEDIKVADDIKEAQRFIEQGYFVVTKYAEIVTSTPSVDVVIEATGVPEVGARVAYSAILNRKHIVMLNVETDVTIGPILKKMAHSAGVVYTVSAGDEPGAVKELYDFADGLGFEVLVIGKGKNNPVDRHAIPDSQIERAQKEKANPKMLTSFVDGTKTMVEMTCVSNATGFLPDVRGMHGVNGKWENLVDILKLTKEGGILNSYKVVEYVNGVAPGVFVIVRTSLEAINEELRYLKMGEGPNYLLYRPYHLTSIETPISAVRAYIYHEPTIAPKGKPFSETVTVAKKDLKEGEFLDGIGMYTIYGLIEKYESAKAMNALPIGLVNKNTKVKRNIKKDEIITYDDVELDNNSIVVQLRKLQDSLLG
ncbi:MAG: NAD(P)-dependent oxidoreductase [Thermoanaerobacter sp.]|nr:NAD(P)-dependent oxidoreductase [Thermoanaerobacter sp.]